MRNAAAPGRRSLLFTRDMMMNEKRWATTSTKVKYTTSHWRIFTPPGPSLLHSRWPSSPPMWTQIRRARENAEVPTEKSGVKLKGEEFSLSLRFTRRVFNWDDDDDPHVFLWLVFLSFFLFFCLFRLTYFFFGNVHQQQQQLDCAPFQLIVIAPNECAACV